MHFLRKQTTLVSNTCMRMLKFRSMTRVFVNLGLHMDSCMMFDKRVTQLTKKTLGTLMYINRVSINLNKDTRKIVVQLFVSSKVNYCISIWGTTNTTPKSAENTFFFFFFYTSGSSSRAHKKARYSLLPWKKGKKDCPKREIKLTRRDVLTLSSWKRSSHRQGKIQIKGDRSRVYQ